MYKNWSDISVAMYLELVDIFKDNQDIDDINTMVLSIILDISLDDVDNMLITDYIDYVTNIDVFQKPIPTNYKNDITIDEYTFHLINFNNLEIGAFIDLEHLLKGDDYIYNLPKILSTLYRQEITPRTSLEKPTYEPYGSWWDVRDYIFEKSIITDVYGVIDKYVKFRTNIYTTYEGLFEEGDSISEDEEIEMMKDMTGKERDEYNREKNISKYGWELMLMRLSNNDPTKIKESSKIPIIEAFNLLGMMNQLKIG